MDVSKKWWYPTTMGFPTKNDHFGVFWGYHHLRNKETPIYKYNVLVNGIHKFCGECRRDQVSLVTPA